MKIIAVLFIITFLAACESNPTPTSTKRAFIVHFDNDAPDGVKKAFTKGEPKLLESKRVYSNSEGKIKIKGLNVNSMFRMSRNSVNFNLENVNSLAPIYSATKKDSNGQTDKTKESTQCGIFYDKGEDFLVTLRKQSCSSVIEVFIKALALRDDVEIHDNYFISGNLSCRRPKELLKDNPNMEPSSGMHCEKLEVIDLTD